MKRNLRKILFKMSKICIYGIIVHLSLFTLVFATNGGAQTKSVNEIKVSFDLKSPVKLDALIRAIETSTSFSFSHIKQEFNASSYQVSLNSREYLLGDLLRSISSQTDLAFHRVNEYVQIRKKEFGVDAIVEEIEVSQAITGTVTDENGEPLPGATVVEKGTTNGTITDIDGQFSISLEPGTTLLVSFVGYIPQEITVSNETSIEVVLQPDFASLEEVVVVGYGSSKKEDLTGAVAGANIQDFENAPNTNIGQMIQGTVPGLNIGQVNSAGKTPSIQIRGKNTLAGNEDVLIILDGVPFFGSLSSINPSDIESISVLKDASSAAVYGAQSANGVILVTTKKGKAGENPRISFSSSFTTQQPTVNLRPQNRGEYLNQIRDLFWDESYNNDGTLNEDFNIVDYVDPIMTDVDGNLLDNNYDWWNEATGIGHIFENQLSVSGGNKSINYLFSFSHTDQAGYIINDKFKRNSIRINLESQVADWLKIGVNSMGSFVNQDGSEPGLWEIMTQSPLLEPFDEDGNLIPYPFNTQDRNPFTTYYVEDYERHNYLSGVFYTEVNFPFLEGLKYRLNFGNNYTINKSRFASEYEANLSGEASKTFEDYHDYTLDNILTYSNTFGKHGITATFLYGSIARENSEASALAREFSDISLGYDNLSIGANQFTTSSGWKETGVYQMARLNYKFDNRYLVTATVRRDGFSAFAANRKYGVFPSVALGWVLSEESFFQPDWVDFLKLRAGYGLSGNKADRYSSLARLNPRPAYVFGDGGSAVQGRELVSLENRDLGWEKTAGLNVGAEFSILKDRLSGTVDYYRNITTDLLFNVKIPNITGFDEISSNIGEIENKGVELLLNSTNITAGDFVWQTTINFSRNVNEVVRLTGEDKDGDGIEDDLITSGLFIGRSLDAIYDYEVNGIYQLDEEGIPAGYSPGTFRIVDQNLVEGGDYEITPVDDRVFIGKGDPAYRFGILNKFTYKGFKLTVFLNSIQGGKDGYLANNTPRMVRSDNTIRWNTLSGIDFWTPGNPNGKYPQSLSTPTVNGALYQDRSFVRLQDISLAYNFNAKVLNRMGIENLNLFVSGKNLAIWTDWEGWDPETDAGLAVGERPVMKGLSVGMNVTF